MVNYRDMLRLSEDPNISKREMERVLHCSHHTIDEALAAAKAKGIDPFWDGVDPFAEEPPKQT